MFNDKYYLEKFEDIKMIVRRYPLKKNRQYNGQKVSIEEGQTIQWSEGIH
jgi:hypothetical protein